VKGEFSNVSPPANLRLVALRLDVIVTGGVRGIPAGAGGSCVVQPLACSGLPGVTPAVNAAAADVLAAVDAAGLAAVVAAGVAGADAPHALKTTVLDPIAAALRKRRRLICLRLLIRYSPVCVSGELG
jgi:hypothetical protein